MEQSHHLCSTLDSDMDMTDNDHMEGMKMETDNKQAPDQDFSARLSDETHQHLTISEGPSSSCRRVRVRSRPRLLSTKSFPPYSQCIGGLGEDQEGDSALNSSLSIEPQTSLRQDDTMRDNDQDRDRKEGFELNARCARDEVRAKWRMRRREKLGGSYEADPEGWERARWSGKRRVEETGREREHDDEDREGATNSEWRHCRSRNSSLEIERKEREDEEWKRSISAAEGENEGSGETPDDEMAEELPEMISGPTTHQWSTPHPILSKLLHSSCSTSSCSSISLSSAESDEVFSEGEDAGSKRRTFRKVRSGKDAVLNPASQHTHRHHT